MRHVCLKNTLCSSEQFNRMKELINRVRNIKGSFVECGVWKGGMSMWMTLCQKEVSQEREIYLYDTFNGMTKPDSIHDCGRALKTFERIEAGEYKRDYDNWHSEKKWAYAPLDLVRKNMESIQYDGNKIHYIVGDVLETLNEVVPEEIVILRLDTDWYESTKKELEILFPKLVKGGFLIVDDYHNWKGATIATDEFLIDNKKVEFYYDKSELILKKI